MIERHAIRLREMAVELERMAQDFDDSSFACDCCEARRYNNFPQKQLRERVEGAAVRLTEIADTLKRRKHDPVFLRGKAD